MSKIEGKSELIGAIHGLNQDKALRKSIRKWTEYVRGEAVDLCPVDTGELQQSIHSSVSDKGSDVVGTVYTDKEYAAYVEFGTGRRGADTSTAVSPEVQVEYSMSHSGQPAQPYMYPALNNNQNRIMRGVREDMQKAMKGVN